MATAWHPHPLPAVADAGDVDLFLNGRAYCLAGGCSIAALLAAEDLAGRRVAIEVNGVIVPRSAHASHRLRAGDRIEIVHALGGG